MQRVGPNSNSDVLAPEFSSANADIICHSGLTEGNLWSLTSVASSLSTRAQLDFRIPSNTLSIFYYIIFPPQI